MGGVCRFEKDGCVALFGGTLGDPNVFDGSVRSFAGLNNVLLGGLVGQILDKDGGIGRILLLPLLMPLSLIVLVGISVGSVGSILVVIPSSIAMVGSVAVVGIAVSPAGNRSQRCSR